MKQKDKLAIFDLDGTLFDTTKVNYYAYNDAISQCNYQATMDYEYYCKKCDGNSYKSFLPDVIPKISQDGMELIHNKKKGLYKNYIMHARKNDHLFEIISIIKQKYIVCIVTTASLENVIDILEAFSVTDMFDFFITQEDVANLKPAPDCFLLAMEKANVCADDTIVFEDSQPGVDAAKAAGLDCLKVLWLG